MTIKDKPWSVRSAVQKASNGRTEAEESGIWNGSHPESRAEKTGELEPARRRSIVPYKVDRADLRRQYGLTMQVALIMSLTVILGFLRAPMRGDSEFEITLVEQENVQMEEIRQTKQEMKPPPPPRPPVPIEVPDDEIIDDVELDLDATLDISEPISSLPPPPAPASSQEEEEEDEAEIFVIVEQMPEIIGGTEAIYQYLTYPEMARKAGLEGLVVVQVVVETNGVPTDPQVVRSPGAILDQAAVDAVMKLRFKPGMQRGKPVRVRYALPVRFRLNER